MDLKYVSSITENHMHSHNVLMTTESPAMLSSVIADEGKRSLEKWEVWFSFSLLFKTLNVFLFSITHSCLFGTWLFFFQTDFPFCWPAVQSRSSLRPGNMVWWADCWRDLVSSAQNCCYWTEKLPCCWTLRFYMKMHEKIYHLSPGEVHCLCVLPHACRHWFNFSLVFLHFFL